MLGFRARARQLAATASVVAFAHACGDNAGPDPAPGTTPAAMAIVSGNNQSALVGAALANAFVARVTNTAGDPLSGVAVTWSVTAGGGTLGSTSSTSNAQGEASTTYTLGAAAGANEVVAAIAGMTSINATFTATATPLNVTPTTLTIVSGDAQTGTVGQVLPAALIVRVANSDGDGLPGVDVAWTVASGGGIVGSASTTTNAQGQTSTTHTLGGSPGANEVRAAVADPTNINALFTATGNPAPPPPAASITVGDNFYNANDVSINVGETVLWTWAGSNPHSVTFDPPQNSDSGIQTSGTSTLQFNSASTFTYFCTVHGRAIMSGQVVVN